MQCASGVERLDSRHQRREPVEMMDEVVTTADLLAAWRDATRAADLAERLARIALETVNRADAQVVDADTIAALARRTCESADRAAKVADEAAVRATGIARLSRAAQSLDAQQAAEGRLAEGEAERLYHEADDAARRRVSADVSGP